MTRRLANAVLSIAASIAIGAIFGPAFANPTGTGTVRGSVSLPGSGPQPILNWQTFSIGTGEATKFTQPYPPGAVLNRVQATTPALANGTLFPRQVEAVRMPGMPAAGAPVFFRDGVYLEMKLIAPLGAATGATRGENGVVRFVK